MRKKTILRFLIAYLCVVLPVLITTIHITQDYITDTSNDEIQNMNSELLEAAEHIVGHYSTIPAKGIALFNNEKFSSLNIMDSDAARMEAVSMLHSIQNFSGWGESILVYYGEGSFITASGTVTPLVYFRDTLVCEQGIISEAVEIINNTKSGMLFLPTGNSGGYLLHHISVGRDVYGYQRSLQVITTVSEVGNMLRAALRSENVVLQMQVGKQELFFHNTQDGCKYLPKQQAQALLDSFSEKYQADDVELDGIGFRLYFDLSEQMVKFYHIRNLSIIILIVGVLFSLAFAVAFSFARFTALEKMLYHLRHKESGRVSSKHLAAADANYIQAAINEYITENTNEKARLAEYKRLLFKHISLLIFSGSLTDENEVKTALSVCSAGLSEEFYFVIGMEVADDAHLNKLEQLLQGDIRYFATTNTKKMMFVLCEIPHNDEFYEERCTIAERLFSTLESVEIHCIRIGISRVYSKLGEAKFAYSESYHILTNATDSSQNIIIWDAFSKRNGIKTKIMGVTYINKIRQAIANGDANAVIAVISDVLNKNGLTGDTIGHKNLAEAFSRLLITELRSQSSEDIFGDIADKIRTVETDDYDHYVSGISQILEQHFAENDKNIAIAQVLRFVEEHYCQYDFSLKMVADFAGCSKPQMSRTFRNITGTSYLEYVTNLRMMKAKELLEQTDMNIKDLFGAVGYLDAVNARKKFTMQFGMTPSAYRAQFRNTSSQQE